MLTRRKAFTAIELLLVIGVLVILIAIVAWGLKGAGNAGSGNATRTTLANLTNMSEELNRKNKFAGFDLIYPPPPAPPVLPMGAETAPGLVTADSKNSDRLGPAVQRTAEVMGRITSIPDNKRIMEKFPSDQLLVVPPANPYSGGTVVLDGWKNPILFVPSTGLAHVQSKMSNTTSGGNYSRGARVIYQGEYWTAIDSTSGSPPGPNWFAGVRSPDGRPFWASAGPDGAFGSPTTGGGTKTSGDGDDNIYSFEH